MQFAKRLEKIPPYLFAEIDRKRDEMVSKGVDIINMGVGDPDKPTPQPIVQAMHEAIDDSSTHNYPPYQGTKEFLFLATAKKPQNAAFIQSKPSQSSHTKGSFYPESFALQKRASVYIPNFLWYRRFSKEIKQATKEP